MGRIKIVNTGGKQMAHKKSSDKKSLLNQMSDMAMPERPKPSLRLHGKEAKRFLGTKPGAKVSATIRGVLQSTGLDEYRNQEPTAEILINKITPKAKKA